MISCTAVRNLSVERAAVGPWSAAPRCGVVPGAAGSNAGASADSGRCGRPSIGKGGAGVAGWPQASGSCRYAMNADGWSGCGGSGSKCPGTPRSVSSWCMAAAMLACAACSSEPCAYAVSSASVSHRAIMTSPGSMIAAAASVGIRSRSSAKSRGRSVFDRAPRLLSSPIVEALL